MPAYEAKEELLANVVDRVATLEPGPGMQAGLQPVHAGYSDGGKHSRR